MSNCGEYKFNMFIILPAYFNTLCNIKTWSELVSESGGSCFMMSLMWSELSWGELSCVQTFRPKSVSPNHSHQDNSPEGLYIKFLNGSSEFTHH